MSRKPKSKARRELDALHAAIHEAFDRERPEGTWAVTCKHQRPPAASRSIADEQEGADAT